MSIPFTSAANQTWQNLLDEITLAYSERRQAIGQDAYAAINGRDVQAAAYWTALQYWLETYCVAFVDHVSGPVTVYSGSAKSTLLMFDLASWRAAAGLNASGFRRAQVWNPAADPVWLTPGLMQPGDIIGPWIFEDLQKGFSALRWTDASAVRTDCQFYGHSASDAEGYDHIADIWDTLSWDDQPAVSSFAAAWVDRYGGAPDLWTVAKHKGRIGFTTGTWVDKLDRVSLYSVVTRHPYGDPIGDDTIYDNPTYPTPIPHTEAPGNEGDLALMEDFTGCAASTFYKLTEIRGAWSYAGYDHAIVPDPGSIPEGRIQGWGLLGFAVAKWDFTNQN